MNVRALAEWADKDLVTAYEVLRLALHFRHCTQWHEVTVEGEGLRAVAGRCEPPSPDVGVPHYCYAARDSCALREAVRQLPPEAPGLVCAPNDRCHALLCDLRGATAGPEEILYEFPGRSAPISRRGVAAISAAEADRYGLGHPWRWPSILGNQPADSPIHCIVEKSRAVAVAAAGCPTASTEEVRGVWVKERARRQGLGRDVVASATQGILDRGRRPVYQTSADNAASRRLAESVGYVRRGTMLRLKWTASPRQ